MLKKLQHKGLTHLQSTYKCNQISKGVSAFIEVQRYLSVHNKKQIIYFITSTKGEKIESTNYIIINEVMF